MKLTVKCPHGVETSIEAEGEAEMLRFHADQLRSTARALLLACPLCGYGATGYVEGIEP